MKKKRGQIEQSVYIRQRKEDDEDERSKQLGNSYRTIAEWQLESVVSYFVGGFLSSYNRAPPPP